MNIISLINNIHLSSLFPNGLTEKVLIGQIGFDVGGRVNLNIHTQQKPARKTTKWGEWGDGYNVIVIKLIGRGGRVAHIENWDMAGYCKLKVASRDGYIFISQIENSWNLELYVKDLILQGFETYLL